MRTLSKSCSADDFVFTNGQAEITGKSAELAEVRAKAIRYTAFENRLYGRSSARASSRVVTGMSVVEGVPSVSRKPFSIKVRLTDLLFRLDGEWRLLAGHVSRLPNAEN